MGLLARKKSDQYTNGSEKRFTLRMDEGLFNEISKIAQAHRRSVAKEIECAIADYIVEVYENELQDGSEE